MWRKTSESKSQRYKIFGRSKQTDMSQKSSGGGGKEGLDENEMLPLVPTTSATGRQATAHGSAATSSTGRTSDSRIAGSFLSPNALSSHERSMEQLGQEEKLQQVTSWLSTVPQPASPTEPAVTTNTNTNAGENDRQGKQSTPSPAKQPTPAASAAKLLAPAASPAKQPPPVTSPAKQPTPVTSPAKQPAPAASPAKQPTPATSPAKQQTLAASPAKQPTQVSSPAKQSRLTSPVKPTLAAPSGTSAPKPQLPVKTAWTLKEPSKTMEKGAVPKVLIKGPHTESLTHTVILDRESAAKPSQKPATKLEQVQARLTDDGKGNVLQPIEMSYEGRYQSINKTPSAFEPISISELVNLQKTDELARVTSRGSISNTRWFTAAQKMRRKSSILQGKSTEKLDTQEDEQPETSTGGGVKDVPQESSGTESPEPGKGAKFGIAAIAKLAKWRFKARARDEASQPQNEQFTKLMDENVDLIGMLVPTPLKLAIFEEVYPIALQTCKTYEKYLETDHDLTLEAKRKIDIYNKLRADYAKQM